MHFLKISAHHLLLRQTAITQQKNRVVHGDQTDLGSGVTPNLKGKVVAWRIWVPPRRFHLELQHANIRLTHIVDVT